MKNKNDLPIYDCFVQKWSPENNKTIMEGTQKYPSFLVGEFLSFQAGVLKVRCHQESTGATAPILHKLFKEYPISLSFDETYLQKVRAVLLSRDTDGDFLICAWEISQLDYKYD